jgi:hypothetical protein
MFTITDSHIDFILCDLRAKGIRIDDLQNNLLDHICILAEENLEDGDDFEMFYRSNIPRFYREQLYEIEEETLFLLKRRKCFALLSRLQFFLLLFVLLIGPIICWTIATLGGPGQKNDADAIIRACEGGFVFSLFPLVTLLVLFLTPERFDPLIPKGARILLGWQPLVEIVRP